MIIRIVFCPMANNSVSALKLPDSNTMSEDPIAISVPLPIAILISDLLRAGASFIPSPTMATTLPSDCKDSTIPVSGSLDPIAQIHL